jgi:hypothetical protein
MSEVNFSEEDVKFAKETAKEAEKKAREDLIHYRKVLRYMEANVPIQVLCLPSAIEKALIAAGCLRVYDMFNLDLAEVKGIGKGRLALLTSRLDEFLSVNI